MRSLLVSTIRSAEQYVITALLILALAGCATPDAATLAVPVGSHFASRALTGRPSDTGTMTAYLSDGRVLEGTWNTVTREIPAECVFVVTPKGEVTAQQLASPHLSAITATLGDAQSLMVCAFYGERASGYGVRCADLSGTRWSGLVPENRSLWDLNEFRGQVSITLREER